MKSASPTPEQLAYTAGFFDGEGTISITRSGGQYQFYIQISQATKEPLDSIQEWFGCGIIKVARRPNGLPVWRLQLAARQAEAFLRAIKPYSLRKAREIDLALKYRALIQERCLPSKLGSGQWRKLSAETRAKRDAVILQMKQMRKEVYGHA